MGGDGAVRTGAGLVGVRAVIALAVLVAACVASATYAEDAGEHEARPAAAYSEADAPSEESLPRAPAFEVEDQFRDRHAFTFPRAKPTALILGDRKSGRQGEKWAQALYDRYGGAIILEGMGVGRGVAKWERSIIRFILRKITPYPILLDWKGTVGRVYAFEPKKPNVVVIDAQGRIRLKHAGVVTADSKDKVFAVLDELLAAGAPGQTTDPSPAAPQ